MIKSRYLLLVLLLVCPFAKAVSAPPACTGVLNITGALLEVNDTVYTCVGVPLTFDDASLLDGLLSTRDWVFGDGNEELDALLSAQTSHSYQEEGTYTATLTVASLLCTEITIPRTVIVLGNPQYEVLINEISCHGECDGELTIDVQSVNANLYNVVWNSVGTVGNTISELCFGDYEAVIGDEVGCTDLSSGAVNLPDPELLVGSIDIADTLELCPSNGVADIPVNISGGDGNYQAIWDVSTAISQVSAGLMQFTPTAESLGQMYHLEVLDGNGCSTLDSIFMKATPSFLGGTVSVGANPCVNCKVFQYHYDADPGLWGSVNSTITDVDGNYNFGLIENFLPFTIMADPDENNHPMAAPAFYPEGHLWSTASVLQNICGQVLDKHIDLLDALNMNGTNTFQGTVWYNATGKTQTEEDPIPLIDVVVEKTPPGQAQARVETNQDGEYVFDFVPNSDTTYTLYVSMPGIPVSSTYEILAMSGDETYCELDFCLNIDSTEINICNGDGNPCIASVVTGDPDADADGFSVYPNPNSGRFTIETGKFADTESEIRIVDPAGREVFRKRYAQTPYVINMVNVAEGYYMVQIMNQQEADASPISVMRY